MGWMVEGVSLILLPNHSSDDVFDKQGNDTGARRYQNQRWNIALQPSSSVNSVWRISSHFSPWIVWAFSSLIEEGFEWLRRTEFTEKFGWWTIFTKLTYRLTCFFEIFHNRVGYKRTRNMRTMTNLSDHWRGDIINWKRNFRKVKSESNCFFQC